MTSSRNVRHTVEITSITLIGNMSNENKNTDMNRI